MRELHPRLDAAHFIELFPLETLRREALEKARAHPAAKGQDDAWVAEAAANLGPSGEVITSPYDLAVVEQLRREVLGDAPPSDGRPTDVFVWALGEPPAPHLTKVGGLPYRARGLPWPVTTDGRACVFLGQLSFVDSRDIVPSLPGDVLLVFGDPDNEFKGHHFEWVRLGIDEVIGERDVPPVFRTIRPNPFHPTAKPEPARVVPREPYVVCHGVVHRTFDLPDDDARFAAVRRPWSVACLEATKIGGFPRDGSDRGFLATLGSIQPTPDRAFPWVNCEQPIDLDQLHRVRTFKVGDMGRLNLHLDGAGAITVNAGSY